MSDFVLKVKVAWRGRARRKLPDPVLGLGGAHNTDAAPQTPIIHRSAQPPLILFSVVELDCFQVGGAVKSTHGVQLTIYYSQTNLEYVLVSEVVFNKFVF